MCKDLFYRLNVIPIHIPGLKERREDIVPLARYMLKHIAQEAGLQEIGIDDQAEPRLRNYDWPGNTRELLNVLERVLSTLEGNTVRACDLPFYVSRTPKDFREVRAEKLREKLKEMLFFMPYDRPITTRPAQPRCWAFTAHSFTPTAESHGFSPDLLWSGLRSGCRTTKPRRSQSESAKLSGAKGLPVGHHKKMRKYGLTVEPGLKK